ncbi:hypothetical protein Droror1_Dr00007310 [Drosera rotundifolia]
MGAAQSLSSSTTTLRPPPPRTPLLSTPQIPARLFVVAWRVLMVAHIGLGGYMFLGGKHKDHSGSKHGKHTPEHPSPPTMIESTPPVLDVEPEPNPTPVIEPVTVQSPISLEQQRELLKSILEEKRKVTPMDREDKKRIDQDKAKELFRAETVPRL